MERKAWIGPCVLALILVIEFAYVLSSGGAGAIETTEVGPKKVGIALFSTYLIGVELAGILLLGGLVAAFHIGRPKPRHEETAA